MIDEAPLEPTAGGLQPAGEGWFVLNVRDAAWLTNESFGSGTRFEGPNASFESVGINISVVSPGQPNCLYHRESNQEDFLVLAGECLLLVEGEERPLEAWDFVHCPANTEHVFVGAGDGPCVLLMVGARDPDEDVLYPVSELASRHGAGVETATPSPAEAYAPFPKNKDDRPEIWDLLPWARD